MTAAQAVLFDYSPGHASAMEAAMSPVRFARYVAQNGGDLVKALRLYERNTLVSESFYSALQTVEIVIRNAFHKQLLNTLGPQWFDSMNGVFYHEQSKKIEGVKNELQKEKKTVNADNVVAGLSFGFWTGICAKRYEHTIWTPSIRKPFKVRKLARFDVFNRLDSIRKFRNRIAHHEPILHLDLPAHFARIIDTIRWICGASADWTQATSCFPERWGTPSVSEQIADVPEEDFVKVAEAAGLLDLSAEELARLAVLAAAKNSPAWGVLRLPVRLI